MKEVYASVCALSEGPMQEEDLRRHVDPLFLRSLKEMEGRTYLANHSLGRPLDRMAADVSEGLSHWYRDPDSAWEHWDREMMSFRSAIATIIRAQGPHCIAPKSNAGQGLRAILNCYDRPIHVISTRDEFNSIDHILKAYAARGRITIEWVTPRDGPCYSVRDFEPALRKGANLLVASMIFFTTGQLLSDFGELVSAAHSHGILTVADLYHVAGAIPVNVAELGADFAIGGCYKYLRGGPGAGWLYIHPSRLNEPPRTLDTGWFASESPLDFDPPEQLRYAQGADGWLESTPAILPFYQARAGLEFVLAMRVERLREYCLRQQRILTERLADRGVCPLIQESSRGAFISIRVGNAAAAAVALRKHGIIVDARGDFLRICPDILNASAELRNAADAIALILRE